MEMIEAVQTNFRTLDLNLLRVLSITQPAVSNSLRRLRETLGDDLVRRDGHGITPTPFALLLWPNVRAALDQLQTALVPQHFIPSEARNSFVLAMADATAAELMGNLGQALEKHAPNVSIRVLPLTTRDPRNMLNDGTADMALGYFPAVLADLTAKAQSGEAVAFAHQRLYDGEYVCVMRRKHPLAQKNISLEEFCNARHLLVSFSGRPYGFIDEALASIGKQRRVVMTVNQFFTAGRVVVNSDLLTVLPKHFVPTTGIAKELFMCELPFKVPTLHVDAVWHRRKHAQNEHRWLREQLIDIARDVFKSARPS
ncbi:MAG: HTH-type transcriptional regulator SyrM 1 [Pseudomonadota bacterium]